MNLDKTKILKHIGIIRRDASVFLIDTALHKKRNGELIIDGDARPVYDAPVEIDCRLISRSGSANSNIAAQPRSIEQEIFTALYRMQVPYDSGVAEGDQIIYTDKVTGEEKTLDVLYAPAAHVYTGAIVISLREVK